MDTIATAAKQIDDDAKLVSKVVAALKAYDAAETVKKEKAIILGGLLAEAQQRHPSNKAFEAFLERAGGIQIRRAQDLISFALGRKNFEQHQIENAAAQQRHRDKLKAEKIERERDKAPLPESRSPMTMHYVMHLRSRSPMLMHHMHHVMRGGRSRSLSLMHYVIHRNGQPITYASLSSPAAPICHG